VKAEVRGPKAEALHGGTRGEARKVLVCFAVKEEARPFQRLAAGKNNIKTLIVGVGKCNAQQAITAALAGERPGLVLTCGFAGGLRPELGAGTVVFAADPEAGIEEALLAAGAKRGRFHCVERVAATAAEKRRLRETTGADAVEMESEAVCAVCRDQGIPSAAVRVILDTAEENLPLDFDQLMGPGQRLSYGKLAWALMKSPGKVGGLLTLQRQAKAAAEKLGQVLACVLR
jgi:adenosylhomocysteine nucleosidase